jgi:hypothetical protein
MLGNTGFFIFSVEQAGESDKTNKANTDKISFYLECRGIPFKEVIGHYKGSNETSFVVDQKHENEVQSLAKQYNQESILYVDALGNATLEYLDGNKVKLGKFEVVDSPKGLDSFTFDPINEVYYAAK